MNPLKSEVKILTAEEIGRKMEEMAEGAQKAAHLQQGAKDGLKHAAAKVGDLMAHIDKDVEEGIIDALKGDPLAIAKYAKRCLQKCIGVIDNLATTAEVVGHRQEGRRKGLEEAAKYANEIWKEEKAKLESLAKMLEAGNVEGDSDIDLRRVPTGHPGPTLKSQRLAEDQGKGEPEKPPEEPTEAQPEAKDTEVDKPQGQEKAPVKNKTPKPKAKTRTRPGTKKKPKG